MRNNEYRVWVTGDEHAKGGDMKVIGNIYETFEPLKTKHD